MSSIGLTAALSIVSVFALVPLAAGSTLRVSLPITRQRLEDLVDDVRVRRLANFHVARALLGAQSRDALNDLVALCGANNDRDTTWRALRNSAAGLAPAMRSACKPAVLPLNSAHWSMLVSVSDGVGICTAPN